MGELIRVDFRSRRRMDRVDAPGLRAVGFSEQAIQNMQAAVDLPAFDDSELEQMISELAQSRKVKEATQSADTGFYGSKYAETKSFSTKDVAKRIRQYVKVAFPGWKFSIRSSYKNISVRITHIPDGIALFNPEWVAFTRANPHTHCTFHRYSDQVRSVIDRINDELNSYNYDKSDLQSDYFDTKFYTSIGVDWQVESAARADMR